MPFFTVINGALILSTGDGIESQEMYDKMTASALDALASPAEGSSDFLKEKDVEVMVRVYEQLGLSANVPKEIIEHIDRTMIQVGEET